MMRVHAWQAGEWQRVRGRARGREGQGGRGILKNFACRTAVGNSSAKNDRFPSVPGVPPMT
jgi:hypothetical protein